MKMLSVCCETILLLAPALAFAQSSPWTVVRFPSETPVHVGLVGTNAAGGCGKCDSVGPSGSGPSGFADITRGDTATKITISVNGLPAANNYVYLIDVTGGARRLGTIKQSDKVDYETESKDGETFMIIISPDGKLTTLPARNRIVLYSTQPRDLSVIPKQPAVVRGGGRER